MAPVDPKMLLNALNPLLGKNGCLKGVQEAERIAVLMKDANKMVSQCVYINVLKTTTDELVLNKFIESGGWDVLYAWLQECKSNKNDALLQELLKLYVNFPVTVGLLKRNGCAKTIKSVSKSSDNEEIKKLSSDIVTRWMKTVRGDASDLSTTKKKKADSIADAENHKNGEKSKHHRKERRNSAEKKDSAKQNNESGNNKESVETKSRPKTVKLHNSKFRSTGLEEDIQLPKVIKKKTSEPAKTIKRPVLPGASKSLEPPEKKVRPPGTTSVTTASVTTASSTDRAGGVKMIAARPRPPVLQMSESSGFMDAIATAKPVARKRKKAPSKPTTPTSPTPPKQPAVPSFYQDTLDTNGDEAMSPDAKEDSVANSEAGDQSEASESSSTLDGSVKKKKKKTVSWAQESNLHTYHYFEMEEGERVNVNRVKDSDEMKKKDLMMDRQAVENVKKQAKLARDKMTEEIQWYHPILISDLPSGTEKGSKSKEKDIQKQRETAVLQILFFSKETLPDSGTEPDPTEYSPPTDPVIIPLNESGDTASPDDPSGGQMALPDELATLVANVAHQGTAPQLLSNVMSQSTTGDISTDQLKQILGSVNPINDHSVPSVGRGGLLGNAPPGFQQRPPGFHPGPPGGMPVGPPVMGPGGMMPGGQWMGGPRMRGPMPGRGAMRGGMRGPPTVPCRFYTTKGSCRNGMMCTFLHPGINGPQPAQH